MSMTIYAAVSKKNDTSGYTTMDPVHHFDCADAQILAEDADARAERGEDPFVANPRYKPGVFMDLANANARFLFDALGFDLDEGISLPIAEVQAAALKGLNGAAARTERAACSTQGAGGMVIHDAGVTSNKMQHYLESLLYLARNGRAHGATHIVVA